RGPRQGGKTRRRMTQAIRTAAVIGAGVMGSAIAAHLAGAGIQTHLLDIVPPDLKEGERDDPRARTRFAQAGLERALAAKPALFYDADAARLVRVGNLEDHLERLRDCDLVIEAVVENLEVKRRLFERIAPLLKDSALLASNTSGLSIAEMSAALPAGLAERFLVMHFFNPVRYMRLLELASGPKTRPEVLERAAAFGEYLGKGIVYAKDTPNFVANRIGVYSLMFTMHHMLAEGLSIEAVDKIVGRPMGRPKSAAFGTSDLVGIDTMIHVAKNCYDSLPDDEEREVFRMPEFVLELAKRGQLGRKSGAGFYKKVGSDILVLDHRSLDYRPQEKVRYDSLGAIKNEEDPRKRLKKLIAGSDAAARFAWTVLSRALCYSARRIGEIADDVVNVDRAMRWGFNWDLGPFEAWDAIGVEESVARMREDGLEVPPSITAMLEGGRKSFYSGAPLSPTYWDLKAGKSQEVPSDPEQLSLPVAKARSGGVVKSNLGASLVDIGDGVLCLELHTKMNTIDGDVIEM